MIKINWLLWPIVNVVYLASINNAALANTFHLSSLSTYKVLDHRHNDEEGQVQHLGEVCEWSVQFNSFLLNFFGHFIRLCISV